MSRTKFRVFILLAPVIAGLALLDIACGGGSSGEKQVLTNFFRASRVRDNATLANLSAVSFDPRTDGSVQSFDCRSSSSRTKRKRRGRTTRRSPRRRRNIRTPTSRRSSGW
jgi:hypothetical protein